jgi:formylglycine-generating enzyme
VSLALLEVAAAACDAGTLDPRPQWTIFVGTDAPVPQLGDRLLIELLDADGRVACAGCRREFGVVPASTEPNAPAPTFPLSFGVVEEVELARVRARLYRTARTGIDGLPEGDHLDAAGSVPSVSGVTTLGLSLSMACWGVAGDARAETTCDPATGALAPVTELPAVDDASAVPSAGTWPEAATRPCSGPPPQGMVCIEGGLFLLGAPDPIDGLEPLGSRPESLPEHLVIVSPFALDIDEFTVGEMRELVRDRRVPVAPLAHDPAIKARNGLCTFPADVEDGSRDAYPVNCVTRQLAEAACEARGKRLPWEVEWEFAAGGRVVESTYPWGEGKSDLCSRAVVSLGRTAFEIDPMQNDAFESTFCRDPEEPPGPREGGAAADVTPQGVRNMAGNVEEWVADAAQPYDAVCWNPGAKVVTDARCLDFSFGGRPYSLRGASYRDDLVALPIAKRKAEGGDPTTFAGFRCAKSL